MSAADAKREAGSEKKMEATSSSETSIHFDGPVLNGVVLQVLYYLSPQL
jgi:hypothetical protein